MVASIKTLQVLNTNIVIAMNLTKVPEVLEACMLMFL